MPIEYDLIVVGAGASGIIASIKASQNGHNVLVLEKLPQIASKLKASGGGKCNLTNILSNEAFMEAFGINGKFMRDALNNFDSVQLIEFLNNIGVRTNCLDGFRVFPSSKKSTTIIKAFEDSLKTLNVTVLCSTEVTQILSTNNQIVGLKTKTNTFKSRNILIATGGLGYPSLGATGDGYKFAYKLGHHITELYPAMMPLKTKETWVKNCTADTISNVSIKINLPKAKKLKAKGDLIFTSNGIRGPLVLDFARDITPFFKSYDEVPILLNLTKGKNEEEIREFLKYHSIDDLLPNSVSKELVKLSNNNKEKLIKLLAWTPLTIVKSDYFKNAMVTRGGIELKEINPKTMESKIVCGLYFCGEILNLDGPCGGYNLQWAFSSGVLSATSLKG